MGEPMHMRDCAKFAPIGSPLGVPICRHGDMLPCTEDSDQVTCPVCIEAMALRVEHALAPVELPGIKQYRPTLQGLTDALRCYIPGVQDITCEESRARGIVYVTLKLPHHRMGPIWQDNVRAAAKAVFREVLPLGVVADLKLEEA